MHRHGQGDGRATRLATGPEPVVRGTPRAARRPRSSPSDTPDSSPTGSGAPASDTMPASRTSTSDAPRGLDKDLVLSLADGRWVREHLSILIIGPAGVGKSWIACALAHSACRHGHRASYRRLPRLLTELAIARADGSYPKLLASLAKTDLSWSSTTSASPSSAPRTAATCSRLPKTAMASAPL